ncbi:beta-glucan synthesis-associated protein-domain-containing protein [Mycena capillaripes]|nr:beta-glucan synthesis-associated protein-domain-containing protein [Mycena capillaripes]
MISSWNKFCFQGGILVSSFTLPGTTNVLVLCPAAWAMGNLGRAGYGYMELTLGGASSGLLG